MSDEVIFKELPETFPKFDKYKKPAAIVAVVFHVVLIAVLVIIPLLMPQRISHTRLVAMLVRPWGRLPLRFRHLCLRADCSAGCAEAASTEDNIAGCSRDADRYSKGSRPGR